jgi:hypothetical protein
MAVRTGAPRIQNLIAEGITRQAKAPKLGFRWDSFRLREAGADGIRDGHSRRAGVPGIPIR